MKNIIFFVIMMVFILASTVLVTCASQQSNNVQNGTATDQPQYTPEKYFKVEKINGEEAVKIIKYTGKSTGVIIPAVINGMPVTAIGERAFNGYEKKLNRKLTNVVIPESVTSIGYLAFSSNRLTNLIIPDSVTSISKAAFESNILTSVILPNNITEIKDSTFGWNQLTEINIPESVTKIGYRAFYKNRLITITIPNNIITIGRSAFSDNPLTNVIFPNGIKCDLSQYYNSELSVGVDYLSFPSRFVEYYYVNEKKAGTYSFQDRRCFYNGVLLEDIVEIARQRDMNNYSFLEISWSQSLSLTGRNTIDGIQLLEIDGKSSRDFRVFVADMEAIFYTARYRLNPGVHELKVTYNNQTSSGMYYREGVTVTTITGNGIIRLNFEVGKSYALNAKEVDNKIEFSLSEIPYRASANEKINRYGP